MSNPETSAPEGGAPKEVPAASTEFSITVRTLPGESIAATVGRLSTALMERDATILMLMSYGSVEAKEETIRALRRYMGAIDWPVLWVEGASCEGQGLSGLQVYAIEGMKDDLQRIVQGGRVIATVYEDGGARHCLVGGLGPNDVSKDPAAQCNECFENFEKALAQCGFTLADVARTWFYNKNILAWYDDFNRVRTSYYSRRPFRIGSLPASTAVEGTNPLGAALTLAAWAVQPLQSSTVVREVASPLQCPAPAYGSSFSRAMEIISGNQHRVLISGTASIEPGGKTVHLGDARKQIDLTMEVVAAMLHSRELDFKDTTRALAYCKDPSYANYFADWLRRHGHENFPYVPVHCDICRGDLLFELELDACAKLG